MKYDPLKITGMHAGAKKITFDNARHLRQNMTTEEQLLWEYLRTRPKGYKFRRQHPFASYILDFYCHAARVCIEVDGLHHSDDKQRQWDCALEYYGLKILRFSNDQVLNQFAAVTKTINDSL